MTKAELAAGTAAVRTAINASGYGRWVSDAQCEQVAAQVLQAAEQVRAKAAATKAKQ